MSLMLLGVLVLLVSASFPHTRSAAHVGTSLEALQLVRAKMDELRAAPALTTTGTDTVAVRQDALARAWTSTPCDMDGDGNAENDAFEIRVEIGEVFLETIRTNPGGIDVLK